MAGQHPSGRRARWSAWRGLLLAGLVFGPASGLHAADGLGLTLALVGDVMPGSTASGDSIPPGDGSALFLAARRWLAQADLALGNLEYTLGPPRARAKAACGRCYAFRSPARLAAGLRASGFDGWSQANNHARDFGDAGVTLTRQVLARQGMASTGPLGEPPARWQVRGHVVCLLAFAPNRGMQDLRDIAQARTRVAQAKRSGCDMVLVTFHGGGEGAAHQHTPRGDEHFLGEDRGDVRAFAHAMVEAGAALVFGQGPHVLRGLELWHGRLILYSLGNFVTYGGISVDGPAGWSVVASVRLAGDGRFLDGTLHSFLQSRLAPLRPDPAQHALHSMARLTQEDFGGGSLVFAGDGRFKPADSATAGTGWAVRARDGRGETHVRQ